MGWNSDEALTWRSPDRPANTQPRPEGYREAFSMDQYESAPRPFS
jgi:hypothetical protein